MGEKATAEREEAEQSSRRGRGWAPAPPPPLPLTVVVRIHLAEDFLSPLFWGRLVLRHLHHGRNHLVNGLGRRRGRQGVRGVA